MNYFTSVLIKTAIIEGLTFGARFGLKMDSKSNFHHGYIGLAWLVLDPKSELAMSLFLSDLIHHFLLWKITGDSEVFNA